MRTVAALCRGLAVDPRTDGELLTAFANGRDEAALTELVRRHGPLVWGTCRRLLHDPADAEDAFQATFLVLVRRAGQLSGYSCVGPWLHRVTVLTARNVRRKNVRRLAKQTALPDPDHVPGPSIDPDLKADLDAALLALPSRYRDPIVLCHLLGFTRREAAERLGCPEGTLSGWLNRGLAKLRDRLRGLDPSKALAGGAVAVPATLCASTARAAVASTVAFASVNPAVSLLVEGVLRMFWVQKATAASVALCAVFALGVGIGLGTRTEYSGATAQEGVPPTKAPAGAVGPTSVDNATLIAALEREIVELELFREKVASAAKELAESLPKGRPGGVPPTGKSGELQSAEEVLAKLQEQLKVTDADLTSAKARLAKLKTDAKPEPAKSAASALDNIFGPPAEAEVKVKAAQQDMNVAQGRAEVCHLELIVLKNENKNAAAIERAAAKVVIADADYKRAKANVQLARSRLAAARAMHAPPLKALGACIEVVVVDGPAPGVCRVREYGRGGTLVGSVLAEDAKALELILSRAMKDPAGPRDFWLVVSADHSPDAIIRAAKAGKAAGLTQVKLKGTVSDGLEATKAMSEREFNGASFDLSKFAP